MDKIKLCAFADEASSDIFGQVKALNRNEIEYVEVRGINGKNIADMNSDEVDAAYKVYSDNGIKVWSIGSPIGKIDINDDFAKELDRFKKIVDNAVKMNAYCIRIFSFYGTNGDIKYRDEVMEKLCRYVEVSAGSNVVLCHENERGIYGDVALRCLDIHRTIPQIKAVFDPANFNHCNQNVIEAWDMLKPYVYYNHIKDATEEHMIVPAGYGATGMDKYLKEYVQMGGGVLTLEPHLMDFVGLGALAADEDVKHMGVFRFKTNDEAFDFAVESLKKLIRNI